MAYDLWWKSSGGLRDGPLEEPPPQVVLSLSARYDRCHPRDRCRSDNRNPRQFRYCRGPLRNPSNRLPQKSPKGLEGYHSPFDLREERV